MKTNDEEDLAEVMKGKDGHKTIVIFNITAADWKFDSNTNKLINKMNDYAKKNNIDVSIKMDSASKIDTRGKEADIILLGPELFAMEEEVKSKYPDKTVKVIDKKDFGLWNGENVLKAALA